MKIIILGSTGFLGTALTKKLKRNSLFKIYELSKSKNIDLRNLNKARKFILKKKPQVIVNCAGNSYSVHHIAKNPSNILKNDLQMHLNIYKIAEELKVKPKVINLLCNCAYPGNKKIQNENNWDGDKVHKSVYVPGNIHRFRQIISKASFEQFGIKSINLLIGGLFGPGDYLDEKRLHALDGIIYRMTLAKKKKD